MWYDRQNFAWVFPSSFFFWVDFNQCYDFREAHSATLYRNGAKIAKQVFYSFKSCARNSARKKRAAKAQMNFKWLGIFKGNRKTLCKTNAELAE